MHIRSNGGLREQVRVMVLEHLNRPQVATRGGAVAAGMEFERQLVCRDDPAAHNDLALKILEKIDSGSSGKLKDFTLPGMKRPAQELTHDAFTCQAEWVGRATPSLGVLDRESRVMLRTMAYLANHCGGAVLSCGGNPFRDIRNAGPQHWIQLERYSIIQEAIAQLLEVLNKQSPVHQTGLSAATQVTIDAFGPEHAVLVARVMMELSSILTVLLGNDPMRGGRKTGKLAVRLDTWTDFGLPDRVGIAPRFHSVEQYVDYLVDTTLILNVTPKAEIQNLPQLLPFWQVAGDHLGDDERFGALLAYHIGTIWTDARIRPHNKVLSVEMRACCAQPFGQDSAIAAVAMGIVHNTQKLIGLCNKHTLEEWRQARQDAIQLGFRATVAGNAIVEYVREFLKLVTEGLRMYDPDAVQYLRVLEGRLREQESPADRILAALDAGALDAVADLVMIKPPINGDARIIAEGLNLGDTHPPTPMLQAHV